MNPKVEKYIDDFPEETQEILLKIRELVLSLIPEAEEKITYGIPTYKTKENVVHFAGFGNHIGFYPTPSGISKFKEEFKKRNYKHAKGSVQFPLSEDIPYELIKEITEYRKREVENS